MEGVRGVVESLLNFQPTMRFTSSAPSGLIKSPRCWFLATVFLATIMPKTLHFYLKIQTPPPVGNGARHPHTPRPSWHLVTHLLPPPPFLLLFVAVNPHCCGCHCSHMSTSATCNSLSSQETSPRTLVHLRTADGWAVSVAGPTVWNSLPQDMHDMQCSVDSY